MTDQLVWKDARTSCLSLGGDLASVGSKEENNFIRSLSSEGLWLGGTDSALEGTFVWTDGTAWTYQNWASGQPDNHLGDEDCLHMRKAIDGSKWNDFSCSKLSVDYVHHITTYVCEKYLK